MKLYEIYLYKFLREVNLKEKMYFSLIESPQLLKLHEEFLKMLKEHDIEIISFGETQPTRVLKVPLIFVNPNSAGKLFQIEPKFLFLNTEFIIGFLLKIRV